MPDETQKERHAPHVLTTLAGVLIAFLLLAAIYVVYQAAHILFPQNVYETALPAVISDTVEADGVLLFDESYVAGSGNLGYLAADGERVSAGTAVAEVYSNVLLRCMTCWIRWTTAIMKRWMMMPMPTCWPRTSSGW